MERVQLAAAADRDAFLRGVEEVVVQQAGVPEEARAALKSAVASWGADVPTSWFEHETETIAGMQPLLQKDAVLEAGRRQVGLMQRIVSDIGLDAAKADQVRKSPVILAPWVKKPN